MNEADGAPDGTRGLVLSGSRPTESVWDYPRPPELTGDDRPVTVTVGSQVVADTRASLRVLETSHPPVFYLPRRDVRTSFLRPRPGRTHCEWKGEASYRDVVVGDIVVVRAAWSYERPHGPYEALRGHLAFYPVHGALHGRRRSGGSPGGRLLRRVDHARDRRSFQGRSRHLGLVTARDEGGRHDEHSAGDQGRRGREGSGAPR